MKTYKAKYFDGKTPQSKNVELSLFAETLEIRSGDEVVAHWSLKEIGRDPSHLATVVLTYNANPDARLELLDAELLQQRAFASSKAYGATPWGFKKRYVVLWLSGLVLTFALAFYNVRPITRYIASKISHDMERKILYDWSASLNPDFCTLNMAQEFALENMLARLYPLFEDDTGMNITIQVVDSDVENAFALPGSQIWLHRGLLENAASPEELAGILAHEIEHIKQRHILESLVRSALVTSAIGLVLGDLSGVLIIDPETALGLISLKFSRDMETAADDGAYLRLKKAGISTSGIVTFFERNSLLDPGKSMQFFSSHPLSEERIKRFREAPGSNYQPVISDADWKALKGICR